ncbi:hypothetical protein [Persicobacter sp. CCB-QB2]|uniref:hypothetical protein n=1 Tax=Persicobacter sp. CCB-QB2 TaxID=1561025 RepID=UPI0006A9B6F2|nr:hypothetical protein [Persicobacter sp. CCB-QB2]
MTSIKPIPLKIGLRLILWPILFLLLASALLTYLILTSPGQEKIKSEEKISEFETNTNQTFDKYDIKFNDDHNISNEASIGISQIHFLWIIHLYFLFRITKAKQLYLRFRKNSILIPLYDENGLNYTANKDETFNISHNGKTYKCNTKKYTISFPQALINPVTGKTIIFDDLPNLLQKWIIRQHPKSVPWIK